MTFGLFVLLPSASLPNWSVVWDAKGGSPYAGHYDFFLPAVSGFRSLLENENRFESPARRAGAPRPAKVVDQLPHLPAGSREPTDRNRLPGSNALEIENPKNLVILIPVKP